MSRERVLSDADWERIAPLMPSTDGVKSRPFRDHRQVVEGVIYRFRTGIAWRDLPDLDIALGESRCSAVSEPVFRQRLSRSSVGGRQASCRSVSRGRRRDERSSR